MFPGPYASTKFSISFSSSDGFFFDLLLVGVLLLLVPGPVLVLVLGAILELGVRLVLGVATLRTGLATEALRVLGVALVLAGVLRRVSLIVLSLGVDVENTTPSCGTSTDWSRNSSTNASAEVHKQSALHKM